MQGLCFKKKTISPNIFLTCEPLQQHTLGGIGIEFLDSWFDTQNAVLNKKTPHGVALKYTLNIGFSAPAMAHGGFLG